MLLRKHIVGSIGMMGGLPSVLTEFAWAWGQLIQFNSEYLCDPMQGQIVHYLRAKASLHDYARNSLVEQMEGDWLLMLDADHAPEPDIALRMLRRMAEYECDVLTATYVHKFPPYSPVLYQYGTDKGMEPIAAWSDRAEGVQIGSAGAGTLLVRRSVFQRIKDELGEQPFDRFSVWGEDHAFFVRCHTLGIKAFAALDILSPHLQVTPRTIHDYTQPKGALHRKPVQAFAKG